MSNHPETTAHVFSVKNHLENFEPFTKKSNKTFEKDYVEKILGLSDPRDLCDGVWWVEPVFNDDGKRLWKGGFDPITSEIITTFGQVGGKMQTTRRIVEENSSGRSKIEQAFLSLKQKYKLKMSKEGFKVTVDESAAAAAAATSAPPTNVPNTMKKENEIIKNDDKGVEERPFPMLAKTFEPEKPLKKGDDWFPVFTQPKTDGVRVLIDHDEKGNVRFSSRARNDFTYLKEIFEEQIKFIFEKIAELTTKSSNIVIDGELSIKTEDGFDDFQKTISAVKKVKGGLKDDAKERMKICIFSFFSNDKEVLSKMTFSKRLEVMRKVFCKYESKYPKEEERKFVLMETRTAATVDEIKKQHDEYVASGSEGLMIYVPSGIYEPNKRSSYLLKYKEFNDAEGKIVGVKPGKGRESNAAMVDIEIKKGVVITMHPKGDIKTREEWLKNPEMIVGKMMTYSFQGLTDKGIPRFPVAIAIRDYE